MYIVISWISITISYLFQILSYFGSRVDEVAESADSAEDILEVIREASATWPNEQIKVSVVLPPTRLVNN